MDAALIHAYAKVINKASKASHGGASLECARMDRAYTMMGAQVLPGDKLHLIQDMATVQLTASPISARRLPSFDGLRPSANKFSPAFENVRMGGLVANRPFRSLVIKAATVIAPKYSAVKRLGDRVLVKTKTVEQKTEGGILLPTTAQTKPQGGEVVAVGEGKTIGKTKVDSCVKTGAQVVYSKYAGTELEFDGSKHLILKEDDIVGVLETDDVKDLKPLNDRVLIKVAEAEEKTGRRIVADRSNEVEAFYWHGDSCWARTTR